MLSNCFKLKDEKKFLFDIIKPYKFIVVLFLCASLLASIFDGISIGLLIPLLGHLQGSQAAEALPGILQWMTGLIQSNSVEKRFFISVGFVVLAVLMKNVLLGLALRQGIWLSNRITADLRSKIVKLLLTVGIEFHYKSRLGDLLDKTVNYTQLTKDLLIFIIQFIVFSFIFLILFSLMMMLSWQLTIFALILGTAAMTAMSFYLKQLRKFGDQQAKASRDLTSAVQENLSAVQLIQTFSQEHHQFLKLKDQINDFANADNRVMNRLYWVQPLTEGLGIIVIAILLIGAFVIIPSNNILLISQLLPFLYILLRTITTLKLLNDSRSVIKARWPYLRYIYDLVRTDNKPLITDGHSTFPGLKDKIKFDSVSFSYNGNKNVLENITFAIPRGKTTAIIGKSGAGKSTLANLLLRFFDPQQGVILIDGRPLKDFLLASYRNKIGVVSQGTFLFHDTVKANIAFGMDVSISNASIISAAKKAGAHDFIIELPEGYGTILGDRGVTLSGGQRQRISIARALLKNPEILILDEATSSLDMVTEQKIHDTFKKVSRHRTVIVIAHRLSTIQNADQIIVLKDGCVAESGTHDELLRRRGNYYDLMKTESSASPKKV